MMKRALTGIKPLFHTCSRPFLAAVHPKAASTNLCFSRPTAADTEFRSPLHSERKQGLLAGIAVAAAATYIVATHVQQAPISGRLQLILQWPSLLFPSIPESHTSSASMPKVFTGRDKYLSGDKTPEQRFRIDGDLLVRATYTQLASAVDKLAKSDFRLRRYLCRLHGSVQTNQRSSGRLHSPTTFDFRLLPAIIRDQMSNGWLSVSPANTLEVQSADELVSIVSRAVAPTVLQHSEERRSWNIVNACASPALLAALRASRVRWSASLLLGTAIWRAASTVINTWLPRQQEYEADEVAAVFSKAAGCNPDSMLTALQRAYCASQTSPQAVRDQEVRSNRSQLYIQFGICGMLKLSIPSDLTQGSTAIQQIRDAVAQETGMSSRHKSAVNSEIDVLEGILAEELCAIRNPWKGLSNPHNHLLDRIARLEARLHSANSTDSEIRQQLATGTGSGGHTLARNTLQQQLTAYQTSAAWPMLLQQEALWDEQPRHCLDSFAAVRAMSADALTQRVHADAQKYYGWSVYQKALKMSWRNRHKQQ